MIKFKDQLIDRLIFMHMPKAAGTTILYILYDQYQKGNCVNVMSLKDYLDLPHEEKNVYKVIAGHLEFGVHESFTPETSYTYFTMLRDPIEKVISNYYFLIGKPQSFPHMIDVSLDEFVSGRQTYMNNNGYVRLLSGIRTSVKFDEINESHLDQTRKILKSYFSFVGITEMFEDSLKVLSELFHWNNMNYKKMNVSQNKKKVENISSDIIDVIKERNQYDIKLYDEYKQKIQLHTN